MSIVVRQRSSIYRKGWRYHRGNVTRSQFHKRSLIVRFPTYRTTTSRWSLRLVHKTCRNIFFTVCDLWLWSLLCTTTSLVPYGNRSIYPSPVNLSGLFTRWITFPVFGKGRLKRLFLEINNLANYELQINNFIVA